MSILLKFVRCLVKPLLVCGGNPSSQSTTTGTFTSRTTPSLTREYNASSTPAENVSSELPFICPPSCEHVELRRVRKCVHLRVIRPQPQYSNCGLDDPVRYRALVEHVRGVLRDSLREGASFA
ncbi:Px [Southern cowpea mosaic virus]|uniref:Px n=1 Tax=Southern cowpea mosaic virus TaxID=196398 RepID=UPI0003D406EA|nr:Px [Southern cowpea mosaic virus]